MKYKISEVSKILNMPIDSIRFYEKKGIISPQKDKQTDYRVYDDWDINYLLEYKRFRKMDFSAQEIKKLLHETNFSDYLKLLEKNQESIKKKAVYYQLLEKKNEELINKLTFLDFKFHIETIPCKLFFSHRENFEYSSANQLREIFDPWMEYYALLDNTVVIRKEDLFQDSSNFEWGFSINKSECIALKLPMSERIECFEEQTYLRFIVNAGARGNFSKDLIKPAVSHIEKSNYRINGDISGRLLARINDAEYLRYIEFFIPIEKK
nr:MerR family transcriptional regulator [uncultured Trichococcus sp.]